jgi:hypothetical protein
VVVGVAAADDDDDDHAHLLLRVAMVADPWLLMKVTPCC